MRTLIVLVGLLIAVPASAAWRRVDSPNFVVVGDVSANDLRAISARFEAFHETLSRMLPNTTTSAPVPTVVIVFPNDEAFTPYKPLYQGRAKTFTAGYAAAGRDVNYIAMLNVAGDTDRIVFHEYTHLVIANAVTRAPLWLNEGLAEFYSTFALTDGGKRAQIGRPIAEHLARLNGSLRVPLRDLLKVDAGSPLYNEGDRASDFYAESWALTHMLINAQPSRIPQLGDYLRRVSAGTDEIEAWEQVFGTERTDTELRRYLTRPMFNTMVADFSARTAPVSMTEHALSPAEAASFLASLQLRHLGVDAAARILEPALTNEPGNMLANIAMARTEIARGDAGHAEKRLLALERTGDWFGAYEAGIALTDAAELEHGVGGLDTPLAKATQLLQQVRSDHRELPNVLASLAKIELLADGPPSPSAFEFIARARELAPGRVDYALTQAELYANTGDFAHARSVVGPLMTPVFPKEVREAARRLMGGLVDLEKRAAGAASGPTLPSGRSRSVSVAVASEDAPPPDGRSTRFIPAYRQVQPGERRIDGTLDRIDCAAGRPAVFHVRTATETVELEGQMAEVQFVTFRDDLTGGITCGPRAPMHVYATWREGTSSRHEKVVIAVEFLPKE